VKPSMIPLSPALLFASAHTAFGMQNGAPRPAESPGAYASEAEGLVASNSATAFISVLGYWSHYDVRSGTSAWPFPPTADCNELAAAAELHGVLSGAEPNAGDLFLLWSPSALSFVHTGLIVSVDPSDLDETGGFDGKMHYMCNTLEGSVTATGRRGGEQIQRVWRSLCPARGDRVIRWSECAPGHEFASASIVKANPAKVLGFPEPKRGDKRRVAAKEVGRDVARKNTDRKEAA
jgi:hypothetical protein